MPKSYLKRFENGSNGFYYYDFELDEIKKGHASSFNTSIGYYSDEIELLLSREIETPFGNVNKIIDKGVRQDSVHIELKEKDIEAIYRFAESVLWRSEIIETSIKKYSVFYNLLDEQFQRDFRVKYGIDSSGNDLLLYKLLSKFLFFKNITKTPFVLPQGGFGEIVFFDKTCLIMPISPMLIILFFPEEIYTDFFPDNIYKMFILDSTDMIDKLNNHLFRTELRNNHKAVICADKTVLNNTKERVLQNVSRSDNRKTL